MIRSLSRSSSDHLMATDRSIYHNSRLYICCSTDVVPISYLLLVHVAVISARTAGSLILRHSRRQQPSGIAYILSLLVSIFIISCGRVSLMRTTSSRPMMSGVPIGWGEDNCEPLSLQALGLTTEKANYNKKQRFPHPDVSSGSDLWLNCR